MVYFLYEYYRSAHPVNLRGPPFLPLMWYDARVLQRVLAREAHRGSMLPFPARHAKYLIGVDEAGRGPLAGAVAVGAALVPITFDFAGFGLLKDSKQLSAQKREAWLLRMEREPSVRYRVSFSSAEVIDRVGIVEAVRRALVRAVRFFDVDPHETIVLLDGGLRAPAEFMLQRTIIRGDEQVPVIAMASIVAKVRRDERMLALARRYPAYRFEEHKGYGTDLHRRLLRQLGPCELHRKTFM